MDRIDYDDIDFNKVKSVFIKAQTKTIGILLKEKEWLKRQILLYQEFHPGLPYNEKMELLEVDMQQALKKWLIELVKEAYSLEEW